MNCINKNTLEYQTLKNMSGISEFKLDSTIDFFLQEYGRYPELDEIPGVNSEPHLRDNLGVKSQYDVEYVESDSVLQFTGDSTIEDATKTINNKYKDLEVEFSEVNDKSLIKINKRPNAYTKLDKNSNFERDLNPRKSVQVLRQSLNKFQTLYGINIIPVTNDELETNKWKGVVSDSKTVNAFVYNGNIYVNTDIANIDAPVHELLHIFLGAMRFTDPDTYYELVSQAEQIPNISEVAKTYRDRTKSDLLEEVFVTEFAKYVTGQDSFISQLDSNIINKILYNIHRNLDTMLMGNYSTQALSPNEVMNSSIRELADMVESDVTSSTHIDFMNQADLHRRMSNQKSDLLRKGQLTEICE